MAQTALGTLLVSLLLSQASARHHAGADPLYPYIERVAVDKTVILTQVIMTPYVAVDHSCQ